VVKKSAFFVPVFVDTLKDLTTTKRFGERYGSYPVLRIHDLQGRDIGGRLDTNPTAGIIGGSELTRQFDTALEKFKTLP
jgi:hypothetical protein